MAESASQSRGMKASEYPEYKVFEPKNKKHKNRNKNKNKEDEKITTSKNDNNIQTGAMENKKPLENMDMKKLQIQPGEKAMKTESEHQAAQKATGKTPTLTVEKTIGSENMEIQTTDRMMGEESVPQVVEKPKESNKKQKPHLEKTMDTNEIQTEENDTKMDRQTEENDTKMDKLSEENATIDRPTEENATIDRPTEENATIDRPTEENATIDRPTEENATNMDRPTEENATNMDRPTEENATKMENQAGENATEMDSQSGEIAIKIESSAKQNANEICTVTKSENESMDNDVVNKTELQTFPTEEMPMEKDEIRKEEYTLKQKLPTEKQSPEIEKNEIQAAQDSEKKERMETEIKKQEQLQTNKIQAAEKSEEKEGMETETKKQEQLEMETKEEDEKITEIGKETLQAMEKKQETSKRTTKKEISVDEKEHQAEGRGKQKQKKQKLQPEEEQEPAEGKKEEEPEKATEGMPQQGEKKNKGKTKWKKVPPSTTTEQGILQFRRADGVTEMQRTWAQPPVMTMDRNKGSNAEEGNTDRDKRPQERERPQKSDGKQHSGKSPTDRTSDNYTGEWSADKNWGYRTEEDYQKIEEKYWMEYKEWVKTDKNKSSNSEQRSAEGDKPFHSPDKASKMAHPQFDIEEIIGDLFQCPPNDSLAHCVSQDLHMEKGIAKIFKKRFNHVPDLLSQNKQVGEVAVLKYNGRFIYYLVTKERYFMKPTYITLHWSLEAMKEHCVANQVTNLSIPGLGCGLDRLLWDRVREVLTEVFQDIPIHIRAYY